MFYFHKFFTHNIPMRRSMRNFHQRCKGYFDAECVFSKNIFELINKRQWICFMVIFAFFHKCLFFIFLKLNTIFILRLMTLYWFSTPAKKKTRPYTWQHQSRAVGQEHWGKLNCFLPSNFRPTDRHTDMVTYALD